MTNKEGKKEKILVDPDELKKILKGAVNETFDNRLEIINYKLDAIESQTTRTNGRVTDLESKVNELERDGIRRLVTCPQQETFDAFEYEISEIKDNTNEINGRLIESSAIKNLMLKSITIAGVFFTILFGLIFGILRVLGGF